MADKGGLQLLPENRKKIEIRIPGENRLISIGATLIVLVLIVGGGLWWYADSLNAQITSDDSQLMAIEKSRDKATEQKLITFSKQIGIVAQLIDHHVYWSTGLSKVEAALQGNVQFKSLSAVLSEDTLHIRALSDNYTTIAKQLAAFVADDSVKDVTLDGVSTLTSGKLDFTSKVSFDPVKFLKHP